MAAPGMATVIVEGFSARYLAIHGVATASRITVTAMRPVAIDVMPTAGALAVTRVGDDVLATTHTFDLVPTTATADVDVIVRGRRSAGSSSGSRSRLRRTTPRRIPTNGGGCNSTSAGGGSGLGAGLLVALITPVGRRPRA